MVDKLYLREVQKETIFFEGSLFERPEVTDTYLVLAGIISRRFDRHEKQSKIFLLKLTNQMNQKNEYLLYFTFLRGNKLSSSKSASGSKNKQIKGEKF